MSIKEITLPVENTESSDSDDPQNVRYQITSFPTDFTVKVMFQKWADEQLVIPEFQRHYIWNMPQASRLIESFLLGLPIPQVFLYRERDDPRLLVVDGHQRLATIAMFYQERFANGRLFRLSGVDSRWNRRTYTELSENDRLVLDDSTLRSIVIQQTQPDDNSSVYQIFERLNTGGTQLSAMEIRKAIFHGTAFEFVEKLNRVESWRKLLGSQGFDKRLRDVELVVRVLALAAGWKQYKTPMKAFITDYMTHLKQTSPRQLSTLSKRFVTACDILVARLSPVPFTFASG